jgi:hypothetical protein
MPFLLELNENERVPKDMASSVKVRPVSMPDITMEIRKRWGEVSYAIKRVVVKQCFT